MQEPPRSLRVLDKTSGILVLLGLLVLGFFLAQLASAAVLIYALPGGLAGYGRLLTEPDSLGDEGRVALLVAQGLATIGSFLLPAWLYLRTRKLRIASLSPRPVTDYTQFLWALLIVPASAPLLESIIELNKQMVLPSFMVGFEQWARQKEDSLEAITEYLLAFSSPGQFALGLFVIAFLAGLGEELLFRGLLQNMLYRWFVNPHQAIWVAAIVFSAIHLQFYGFVPRVLLGALFGYLYLWSGNIWTAVLAHFANNAITVTLSYLYRQGIQDLDPDHMPQPSLMVLVASAVGVGLVLYRFHHRYYQLAEPPALL